MDLGIKGETALCMASTQGLGYGCAEALIAAGCTVVINGRDRTRGERAAAALGHGTAFIAADVTKDSERARLFEEAKKRLGHVSILVTNADGPPTGPFLSKSLDDWRRAFDLCMLPSIDLANRAVPDMVARGYGRIINISSISVKEPTPNTPLACGTKLGLIGALATLAREVADKGVTVNSILPGPFDTALLRRVARAITARPDVSEEEAVKLYGQHTPAKRIGTIQEFGSMCAYIASRHAGYMTGQSVVLDGGLVHTIY
ncbi:MAG: SDR family oxidoreductase [Alphaproteobacteria bacterium]